MGCLYYAYRRKKPTNPEEEEAERKSAPDLMATRLALAGYLVGAYFLSRTYVAVLYLLIALPVAVQFAWGRRFDYLKPPPGVLGRDLGRIAMTCIGSVIFIKMMVDYYK
jgi:hypothetical protein